MSETITSIIAREKGISPKHVEATLNLLSDGATIPFISRYRKEATGGLDEVAVSTYHNGLPSLRNSKNGNHISLPPSKGKGTCQTS